MLDCFWISVEFLLSFCWISGVASEVLLLFLSLIMILPVLISVEFLLSFCWVSVVSLEFLLNFCWVYLKCWVSLEFCWFYWFLLKFVEILFLEAHIDIMKCRLLKKCLNHPMNYVQCDTANRRAWFKQRLEIKGWNSYVQTTFRGSFASTNLGTDNLT